MTNTYDASGNQLTQVSGTGTITNTYDQQNRMTSTVNTAGGGTIAFGYDKASREISSTSPAGTVNHLYDASGVLTATSYPTAAGTGTQRYAVDDKGRRTDTWLATNADNTLWAAKTTTSYSSSGKVTQVRAWTGTGNASNTAIFDTTYCYQANTTAPLCTPSPAGDRDALQWSRDNLTGQATSYGYTDSKLTTAIQSGGASNSSWTYSYDSNGNRTGELIDGPVKSDLKLAFNPASQIVTAGYAYDGTGNMTASPGATYTYNGAQQMTSSTKDGVTTRYSYAGTDQNQLLTETTDGGGAYGYIYGGADSQGVPIIVGQSTAGAGTSSVISDPVTGQPLDLTTADGVTGLFVVNGIGNQVGLLTDTRTTAFQVTYSPYGTQNVTAGSTSDEWVQNPYGFKNGNRTDNGAIVKFGLRWYLATTGTWTQRDTLDAPLDPKNANRYGYAGGDPVNASDPTGRFIGALTRAFKVGTFAFDSTVAISGGSVIGFAVGAVVETACYAGATAAGVGTGGVGFGFAVGCYAAGTAIGSAIDYGIESTY